MPDSRPTGLDHFSDEDARLILKRAAEIEKKGVVTETDLREIAAGASISQAAIDKALAEALRDKQLAERTPPDPYADLPFYRRPIGKRGIVVAILAASLVAGLIQAFFS